MKFNTLVSATLRKINEESTPITIPNVQGFKERKPFKEPKDVKPSRDPEARDYNTPTGMFAIEGPNPDKPGTSGYWDVVTGEFLYSKNEAPRSGIHKTSDKQAAKEMVKNLREKHADLSKSFIAKNFAWADENYQPFHVVEFHRQ